MCIAAFDYSRSVKLGYLPIIIELELFIGNWEGHSAEQLSEE